jgi:hypothetical protein
MAYTLKINGVDFSDLINEKLYKTDSVPVVAWEMTDLTGVRHEVVSRRRNVLTVRLKPLTAERAVALFSALSKTSLSVTYTHLQTGTDVTNTMMATSVSLRHLVTAFYENGTTTWEDGQTLVLEQK